ncbi:helix-turn-helix transcriptional regulator [Orbaceae bacterium ac157xtp]
MKVDEIEKQTYLDESGISNFKDRLQLVLEGKSGNAFSKKVGMSEAVIRDYLAGKTYPSLNRLAIIAQKCDVSIEWLACYRERRMPFIYCI